MIVQRYQPLLANDRGWLWCETLGLWLGNWEGSIRREPPTGTCQWLRFYDRQDNLVLLPEELAQQEQQRAEIERQRAEVAEHLATSAQSRAERLEARLRALGVDPDFV